MCVKNSFRTLDETDCCQSFAMTWWFHRSPPPPPTPHCGQSWQAASVWKTLCVSAASRLLKWPLSCWQSHGLLLTKPGLFWRSSHFIRLLHNTAAGWCEKKGKRQSFHTTFVTLLASNKVTLHLVVFFPKKKAALIVFFKKMEVQLKSVLSQSQSAYNPRSFNTINTQVQNKVECLYLHRNGNFFFFKLQQHIHCSNRRREIYMNERETKKSKYSHPCGQHIVVMQPSFLKMFLSETCGPFFFPAWVLKREREAEEKRQGLLDNNSDKRGALVLFLPRIVWMAAMRQTWLWTSDRRKRLGRVRGSCSEGPLEQSGLTDL